MLPSPARPAVRRTAARVLLAGLVAAGLPLASGLATPASAASTVRAADPAPTAAGRMTVVSSGSRPSGDRLVLFGEVRNDWNRVASTPRVHVDLLGANGAVLAGEDLYTDLNKLLPGEHTTFRQSVAKPAGYASAKVTSVTTPSSYSVPNHGFTVTLTGNTVDGTSRTLTGTVRNDNTAAASLPAVTLVLRDAAGTVYDSDDAYPKTADSSSTLAPGATASFSTTRFSDDPYVEGGSISAVAESSSAPSPFPTELGLSVPKLVSAGEAGTVKITVLGKGTLGAAPAGIKVQLTGREARQPAFRLLRTVTTTGSSTVSFDLKPQRDIRWQAKVPAAANAVASASGYTLTQVAFGVSTTGTTRSGSGTLSGGVRPASAGAVVYLQQQTGGVFRNVASYKLSSSSTYTFTVRKPVGRYTYRVYKPAVTGNQAGYGPVMVYTVY
ncbi:MAG: Type secretion-associated serine protease mycosin [Frankiales bacterium]|nr:Type secretion-associated serine protease mycosin [Frankiales bacterium]